MSELTAGPRAGTPPDQRLPAHDPGRADLVARERAAPRRGRLRGPVGLGPLHRPGRPDGPRRRELDDPVDGRRADGARDRRPVRPQRDEPPPGGRGTDGIDPPDRERRPARPRDRHRWRAQGARGLRHRLPGCARARGQARGGRRGHPRAVDRRPGDARLAVLSAARRLRLSDPGPAAAASSSAARRSPAPGWPAGSAMAGRPSTTTSRRTCPPISSRSRPAGAGARTSESSSGSRGSG